MGDHAQSLLLLIILLLLMMIIAGDASEMGGSTNHSYFEDCPVTSCKKHGQEIRFPFRNKDHHQLPQCGYPGFDVSCKGKQMVLQLPLWGGFFVVGIDYRRRIVRLADPNGCLPRRLFNLKLSFSPSQIVYFYERYVGGLDLYSYNATYVNCSTSVSSTVMVNYGFHPVPCLGGGGRYFYSSDSSNPGGGLPSTCAMVKPNMPSLPYYSSDSPLTPDFNSSSIFM